LAEGAGLRSARRAGGHGPASQGRRCWEAPRAAPAQPTRGHRTPSLAAGVLAPRASAGALARRGVKHRPFGAAAAGGRRPAGAHPGDVPCPPQLGEATLATALAAGLCQCPGKLQDARLQPAPCSVPIPGGEFLSSAGLPSSRKMRSYWRESSGGLRG